MNWADTFDIVVRFVFITAIPAAVVWYVRDRRKSRAESEVAERTVPAKVRIEDATGLSAHIAAVEGAFMVERLSKDRHIAEQDKRIERLEATVSDRDEQIAVLRAEVAELKMAVSLLKSMSEKNNP